MRIIHIIKHRVNSLLRRDRIDAELQSEIELHIEQLTKEGVASGMSEPEARMIALREFGPIEKSKEECRDMRKVNGVGSTMQDLRQAWRGMINAPSFSVVAVLTLALGIGGTSAIFSVINAALLKPLPYPNPNQLVLLFEMFDAPNVVSFANFSDWERENRGFSSMAAGRQNRFTLGSAGQAAPERIEGGIYSWALFKTLGVAPIIGRGFSPADDRPGAPRVVVISYGLWQRRFGGARDILHRRIRLDGVICDIIGVMPQSFGYPTRAVEVWTPIQALFGDALANRDWHQLYVLGRIREGATRKSAVADVSRIQQQIRAENPNNMLGSAVTGLPLSDITTQDSRTSLYVLLGAVGCLLMIACVNVSSLLLARGSQRSREFFVRAALGAGRARLMQQAVIESLLLALIGCAFGLLLGCLLMSYLNAHAAILIRAEDIDTSAPIRMDGMVLGFTILLSLLSGVLAGLLPARRAARVDLTAGIKEGGRSSTSGRAQQRSRSVLISLEVGLSFVLLVTAGLLVRSFIRLQTVHSGVAAENLLTAAISLPDARYGPESVSHFAKTLLDRTQALPGLKAVALVNCLPVGGYCGDNSFSIEGRPPQPGQFNVALNRSSSPGYFRVAGIPLLAGRDFTESDGRGFDPKHPHQSALIISESMARKLWPDGHALGQRVYFGDQNSPRYQVVGIVGDVLIDLEKTPQPTMYTPALEGRHTDFYIVARTAVNASAFASALRRAVEGIDSEVPLFQVRTMSEVLGKSAESRAFIAILLAGFAGFALILSAVGLYGILSYLVTQRTAEIGIRMALGANRSEVCRLALVQGMKPASLGLAIGLIAALLLARTLRGTLFGIEPADSVTFITATLVLLFTASIACLVPAWRAGCTNPVNSLRSD
jgi:predicted permease